MKFVLITLIFVIVLFLYLHIFFHIKTSNDLEVYECETPDKDKLEEIYKSCISENQKEASEIKNIVKGVYSDISNEQLSHKISQMLKEKDINAEVEVIYQTIDNLHKACPNNLGDWYFSGEYPTKGGNKVVNQAFINYFEGSDERAY